MSLLPALIIRLAVKDILISKKIQSVYGVSSKGEKNLAKTGYVSEARYLLHNPGTWHVERPDRLRVIQQRLASSGLLKELTWLSPWAAPLEWLERLHSPDYIARFQRACEKGVPILDTGDCGICPQSFEIARLAVGGVFAACDALMAGVVNNAFCAVRPPGHHAERSRARGFCFFNNVALGARYLQEKHGLKRIAIVDWDVHHGNGTQHLFETDPSVLYISLHQDPATCYPGTGRKTETGKGPGQGATLNFPFPPHSKDQDYLMVMEGKVLPALEAFRPDCLMISAGFDAHRDDPLARMDLTDKGYAVMGAWLGSFAKDFCGGRIITVLEGGYNLAVLAECVFEHIRMLHSL
jgi:acetoin utilization deacetylase AcuC-like enzyme